MARVVNEETIKDIVAEALKRLLPELKNVVHKEGDVWKIRGHKGKGTNEKDGDWNADYKTREDAEAALRGYFASRK